MSLIRMNTFLKEVLPIAEDLGEDCTPELIAEGLKARLSASKLTSVAFDLSDLIFTYSRQPLMDQKQWAILKMFRDIDEALRNRK